MLVKLALGLLPNRPTVSVSGSILIAYRSSSLAELQHMPVAQSFQWCFRHKDPNILKPIFSSQVMEPEVNPAIPNTQNTSQEISVKVDPAPTELADIVACSSEVSHNVEIFNAIREVISCCACLSSQTEMKECTNGHLICQSCFLTLRQDETPQCPTCRANLYSDSRRALVAQKVLSELPTFCPNCGMRMLYKSLSSHRLHFCPKRQVICALTCLGCTWSGSADSFPDHKRSCSIKASLLNRPQEENLTAMLTGFRQRDHSLDTLFHCFTSIFRHFEGHELQTLSVLLSCIRTSGNTLIFRSDHFHANHSKWSLEVRLVLAGPRPASSGSNWLSSGPQAKRARMGESSRGQGHLAAGQEQNNSRLSDDDLAVDAATVTRQSLHELFSDVHEADASSEQASEPGPDEETYRDRRDTFSLPLTSSSSPRRRSRAVGYSNFGDIRVQRQRQSQLVQHPQQHLLFLGPAGRTEFIDSSASVDVMTGGNQMVPEMISRLEQRDDGGMLNVTSRAAVAEPLGELWYRICKESSPGMSRRCYRFCLLQVDATLSTGIEDELPEVSLAASVAGLSQPPATSRTQGEVDANYGGSGTSSNYGISISGSDRINGVAGVEGMGGCRVQRRKQSPNMPGMVMLHHNGSSHFALNQQCQLDPADMSIGQQLSPSSSCVVVALARPNVHSHRFGARGEWTQSWKVTTTRWRHLLVGNQGLDRVKLATTGGCEGTEDVGRWVRETSINSGPSDNQHGFSILRGQTMQAQLVIGRRLLGDPNDA